MSAHLQLGRQLPAAAVLRDPGLCVSLAWAAGLSGQFSRMGPWLDAAEPLIDDDSPALEGWHTLRGAAATLRPSSRHRPRRHGGGAGRGDDGCRAGVRPDLAGYVVARTVLGAMLGFADRSDEAVPVPATTRGTARGRIGLPPLLGLQAASILAIGAVRDRPRSTGSAGCSPRSAPWSGPPRTVGQRRRRRGSRGCGPSRAELAHRDGDLARRPRAAAARRRPRPHLRRDPGAGHRADRPRRGGARRPGPRGGPRRAARGPGGRRQRARAPALRAPAGRGRAAGRPDGRPGRPVAAGVLVEELTDREQSMLRALSRRRHPTRDRRRALPVDQHGQGLHEGPLPQARRRHPAGRRAAGPGAGPAVIPRSTRVETVGGGAAHPVRTDGRAPFLDPLGGRRA